MMNALTQSAISRTTPVPHLTYHGGKVLSNPHFVSLLLGKYWGTPAGRIERKYYDDFGKALVNSRYVDLWKEYGVKGATYGGSNEIATTASPKFITQSQIEGLLKSTIAPTGVLPKASNQTVHTVILPPGCVVQMDDGTTSREGVGGFHGSVLVGRDHLYYAVLVHSDGKNGIPFSSVPRDNVTIAASHEWSEAASDPDVNAGPLGWYDNKLGEVSDIPISLGAWGSDLVDRIKGFAVQKNWSNRDKKIEAVPPEALQ